MLCQKRNVLDGQHDVFWLLYFASPPLDGFLSVLAEPRLALWTEEVVAAIWELVGGAASCANCKSVFGVAVFKNPRIVDSVGCSELCSDRVLVDRRL